MNLTMQKAQISQLLCGVLFAGMVAVSLPVFAHAQDNLGYFDLGGYGDAGYTDYSYGGDAGYTDYSYPDAGYTDYSYPDAGYTDYSYPDAGYTDYSYPDAGYTDYAYPYSYDTYSPTYSYQPYSYSSPSYSYSQPFSFAAPNFSYPTSYPRPTPQPVPQRPVQQQQQQQQQQQGGGPIVITNTNTNVNTNVNTAPVTPVYQTPVTYPVQYVYPTTYPTYPTYPTYQQRPYCTISISNYGGYNYGTYGNQLATLTWSSSYGTSAYISPNVGTVAPYGSMTVYPTYSTIYTMTVYGQGGTATCQTTNYYTPPAPYVSLSQIPYTGFDFGTFGNALYWLSLISFAAAGAYLLVYFRGGALALAGSMIPVRSARKTEIAHVIAPAAKVSPVQILDLPVMQSSGTTDTMVLARSKGNEAPRIVITRD